MAENDKNLLSAYNAELEDTMDSMHEIRHDAKNLLLTMGGFVEQSSDVQMKEFYQKNIVPFMENALTRYELQNKLKLLGDDCLKSFLYYKIMEKNEKGIPISLKISTAVISDINYGDLIRLLGILLDNAAEEAALAAGSVRVSISQEEHGLRFRPRRHSRHHRQGVGARQRPAHRSENHCPVRQSSAELLFYRIGFRAVSADCRCGVTQVRAIRPTQDIQILPERTPALPERSRSS